MRLSFWIAVAVAGFASLPDVGAASVSEFPDADDLILRLMSREIVHGVALALIKDGRIVLEKGYGVRDLETQAPVTTATLFNIGSISKSFTALGVAQLVDQQKADLDVPVINYLPDMQLSDPALAQALTLRRLLSHSSGPPSDEHWSRLTPPTRQDIVAEFARMPITAPPGTRFQYCTRCIVLAACVLERITGQSWEEYTQTHIFLPLGMTTATFGPLGLEQAADRAQPYRHDPNSDDVPVSWSRLGFLGPLGPGGGVDANIDEMARYALLQLGDGTVFGDRLISAQMMAELHRPETAVGDDWKPTAHAENLHYALGWFTDDINGVHHIYHKGANPGFRASFALVPSSKAGVVILTNGESNSLINTATPTLLEQLLR
jgi:CubicO group peptidase (beta-lactamase class C family)